MAKLCFLCRRPGESGRHHLPCLILESWVTIFPPPNTCPILDDNDKNDSKLSFNGLKFSNVSYIVL